MLYQKARIKWQIGDRKDEVKIPSFVQGKFLYIQTGKPHKLPVMSLYGKLRATIPGYLTNLIIGGSWFVVRPDHVELYADFRNLRDIQEDYYKWERRARTQEEEQGNPDADL